MHGPYNIKLFEKKMKCLLFSSLQTFQMIKV